MSVILWVSVLASFMAGAASGAVLITTHQRMKRNEDFLHFERSLPNSCLLTQQQRREFDRLAILATEQHPDDM